MEAKAAGAQSTGDNEEGTLLDDQLDDDYEETSIDEEEREEVGVARVIEVSEGLKEERPLVDHPDAPLISGWDKLNPSGKGEVVRTRELVTAAVAAHRRKWQYVSGTLPRLTTDSSLLAISSCAGHSPTGHPRRQAHVSIAWPHLQARLGRTALRVRPWDV